MDNENLSQEEQPQEPQRNPAGKNNRRRLRNPIGEHIGVPFGSFGRRPSDGLPGRSGINNPLRRNPKNNNPKQSPKDGDKDSDGNKENEGQNKQNKGQNSQTQQNNKTQNEENILNQQKKRLGILGSQSAKDKLKEKITGKLKIPPALKVKIILFGFAVVIAAFIFAFLYALFVVVFGSEEEGSSRIVYDSDCNYEETHVIVMDGSNTKVLANISLEDYIIGVACPEIGACSGASSSIEEHYVKTQYVASKTYVLSRGNYNSTTKSITVRASTRDQQWCDLNNGCVVVHDGEYHNTYPANTPSTDLPGSIINRYHYTEQDLTTFHKYYEDTYGELILPKSYNTTVTSLNGSTATEYKSNTQLYWKNQAASGKTYVDIIENMGDANVPDHEDYLGKGIYKLGSYCNHTVADGGTGILVDLGEYPNVGTTKEINKPIGQLLSSEQISNLNNYINTNIEAAGHGTGEAVATAGSALIIGLYQYNYHLPYWYGGGHALGLATGVDTKWGDTTIDPSWRAYNLAKGRTAYSYDCSGFVSWAIKMGCKSNYNVDYTGGFISNYGPKISIKDVKPGDLMVIHQEGGSQHVRLVIKNTGSGVLTAESTSGFIQHGGIQFQEYSSAGGYSFIDMSKWYANNCENIQQPKPKDTTNNNSTNNNQDTKNNLHSQLTNYLNTEGAGGNWAIYVKNIKTNESVNYNSAKQMTAASEIKLFIMAAAYDQINKGKINENDVINDIRIMIQNSDNTAANNLIDKLGMNTINSYIVSSGYNQTKLNRKMLVAGEENYVSAKDIGRFLENLYNGRVVNSTYSSKMLGFLKNQTRTSKIPAGVPSGTITANKTGELSTVENDAAIVYAKGDYIIVVLSQNLKDTSKARSNIVKISSMTYDYFK